MRILGNLSLALAALIYFAPLQYVLQEGAGRRNDGGHFWAAAFVLTPLWLLLAGALGAAVLQGGLDWTGRGREWQLSGVLLVCLSLAVVTVLSYLGQVATPEETPWAVRPLVGWAVIVFPLAALAFGLFTLNPGLGSAVPALVYRVPMAAVAVVGLVSSAGLAFQLLSAWQAAQMQRIEESMAREQERDRSYLARVETLDPVADFPELLGFTSRFETASIRELATAKVESRADFTAALGEAMQNGWPDSGLRYLDARDVTAEQRAALAQPVRTAILALIGMIHREIKSTHTFIPQQFDSQARLATSVADKFADQDVDYRSAIQELRQSLDTDETRHVQLDARATLDAWLAKRR